MNEIMKKMKEFTNSTIRLVRPNSIKEENKMKEDKIEDNFDVSFLTQNMGNLSLAIQSYIESNISPPQNTSSIHTIVPTIKPIISSLNSPPLSSSIPFPSKKYRFANFYTTMPILRTTDPSLALTSSIQAKAEEVGRQFEREFLPVMDSMSDVSRVRMEFD
jgi:hypothetical protein